MLKLMKLSHLTQDVTCEDSEIEHEHDAGEDRCVEQAMIAPEELSLRFAVPLQSDESSDEKPCDGVDETADHDVLLGSEG